MAIKNSVEKHKEIKFDDIDVFKYKNRLKNDSHNKKREYIIVSIINNIIPEKYYTLSEKWSNLKNEIILFIQKLAKINDIRGDYKLQCFIKAGRGNHNDINIHINDVICKVEFKYGATCVNDCPQFVSPMKPSKYLNNDFESWFYDNYLYKIAEFGGLKIPLKDIYCKTIHNNDVECMKEYKDKYKIDKKFNDYCKKIDKEAIKKFIEITMIDKIKLSNYLRESQKDKHYMCYHNEKIYYDTINENLYNLSSIVKKEKTNYIYKTEFGMKLEIKLRFKNGCGLQFPAFQIKRKIPTIKELKQICINHIIKPPKLKKDIIAILDENSIIY